MPAQTQESYIQQLADYIKRNLAKGYTLDSLKISLEQQEYSRTSIENAIKLANEQLAKSAPEMREKPKIKYKVVSDENAEKEIILKKKKGFLRRLFG